MSAKSQYLKPNRIHSQWWFYVALGCVALLIAASVIYAACRVKEPPIDIEAPKEDEKIRTADEHLAGRREEEIQRQHQPQHVVVVDPERRTQDHKRERDDEVVSDDHQQPFEVHQNPIEAGAHLMYSDAEGQVSEHSGSEVQPRSRKEKKHRHHKKHNKKQKSNAQSPTKIALSGVVLEEKSGAPDTTVQDIEYEKVALVIRTVRNIRRQHRANTDVKLSKRDFKRLYPDLYEMSEAVKRLPEYSYIKSRQVQKRLEFGEPTEPFEVSDLDDSSCRGLAVVQLVLNITGKSSLDKVVVSDLGMSLINVIMGTVANLRSIRAAQGSRFSVRDLAHHEPGLFYLYKIAKSSQLYETFRHDRDIHRKGKISIVLPGQDSPRTICYSSSLTVASIKELIMSDVGVANIESISLMMKEAELGPDTVTVGNLSIEKNATLEVRITQPISQ